MEHYGKLKTVLDVYESRDLNVNEELLNKKASLMTSWHAFDVDELINLFEKENCRLEKVMSPASLARFIDKDLLLNLINNSNDYDNFIKF